jgi:hypothetical protein
MRTRWMFVGLLCAAMSTSACGVTLRAQEGFARVDDDHYDRRVASADGVVVGVRVMRNRPEASVDFWIRAVDERLRARGYEPDGDPMATQTSAGMRGVQLRYVQTVGGRPHRYWATVFVRPGGFLRPSKVYVVEAGGDAETFDRAAPHVQRTIASLEP